jgi:hypothetical protein
MRNVYGVDLVNRGIGINLYAGSMRIYLSMLTSSTARNLRPMRPLKRELLTCFRFCIIIMK